MPFWINFKTFSSHKILLRTIHEPYTRFSQTNKQTNGEPTTIFQLLIFATENKGKGPFVIKW
jgi:hypothetical protein